MPGLDRVEPVAGFRLRVELGEMVAGWFTEVNSISVEREAEPYNQGGVNDHQHWLPGGVKRANVTLRHGVAGEALWRWFQKGISDGRPEQRDVSIFLLEPEGSVARRWDLPAALPVRWGGIQLQSDSGLVLVEELELGQGGQGVSTLQRAAVSGRADSRALNIEEPALDLPLLARKVFDLLKEDLRIEQQRRGAARYR